MVAGIFLNSVVIISLWRSRRLRKQLCYFMILVLSCFDLAVVSINHPLLITSTIYYSLDKTTKIYEDITGTISFILCGLSMIALLTLNVERFLALTRPYFHERSVTKTKLVCFQSFFTIIIVCVSPLPYIIPKGIFAVDIFTVVSMSLLLFLLIYGNYKMFKIAKSKSEDERVFPITATSGNIIRQKRILISLKNISTCFLVVGCFFLCSCPFIIYSILLVSTQMSSYDPQELLKLNLWSATFVSINSTLNCLIFFWRNSILRREGVKLIDGFRRRIFH